jgi:hypothetical protein
MTLLSDWGMARMMIHLVPEVNRAFSAGTFFIRQILGALPQVRRSESVSPADESVLCADLWRTGGECCAFGAKHIDRARRVIRACPP